MDHQNIAGNIQHELYGRVAKPIVGKGQLRRTFFVGFCLNHVGKKENMSEESILITLATPGGPTSFPVVLKKVMELPPPNLLDGDDGTSNAEIIE